MPDELTVGDITAATIFQVALNIPGRVTSDDSARRAAAVRGETSFASIGCIDCHKPSLPLSSSVFSEPNPFNPPGNLRVQDVPHPFTFDLTRDIPRPRLESAAAGGAIVRAYTDLKRHVIADDMDPFFRNERLIQNGVPVDQFITRKLWDGGNKNHYGHRGDLTTLTEAILHHAGEARAPARALRRPLQRSAGRNNRVLKTAPGIAQWLTPRGNRVRAEQTTEKPKGREAFAYTEPAPLAMMEGQCQGWRVEAGKRHNDARRSESTGARDAPCNSFDDPHPEPTEAFGCAFGVIYLATTACAAQLCELTAGSWRPQIQPR